MNDTKFRRVLRNIAQHRFYYAPGASTSQVQRYLYLYISQQCMKIMSVFPTRPVFRKEYTRPSQILEFSMVVLRHRGWNMMHRDATSRVIHRGMQRDCKFVMHTSLRIQQRIPLLSVLFLPALCFINLFTMQVKRLILHPPGSFFFFFFRASFSTVKREILCTYIYVSFLLF